MTNDNYIKQDYNTPKYIPIKIELSDEIILMQI